MPEELIEVERYELLEPQPYVFQVTRRELLYAMGAGLCIVATQTSGTAQEGGSSLEARLHVGEDGSITILTGKVEEGQGPRTELALAAAEELRTSVDRVKVVMADTDVVPNDGITAGSRTTPSTVPAVRRGAAAARQLLVATAAQKWSVPSDRIRVIDGAATGPASGQKFTYADLARSAELAKAYNQPLPQDLQLTPASEWHKLGHPQNRLNGSDIVTGAHKFPSDIQRPGMLYGSILRPPSYEATLTDIDMGAVKSIPGATGVRDGAFVGCVAATSFHARKAVEALAATAKWVEKDHPSSSTLFEHLKRTAKADGGGGRGRPKVTGDVEKTLATAERKLQATYTAAYIQHAPMEPRAAVAEWQDGKLTVWTGTSNPFSVRQTLAQTFRIPEANVRVIVPDMGGGFGGKHTGEAAIEAARLAREVSKPVSLRWTRAEEFTWAYCRPAALIEIDAALDQEKRILAWDFVNYNSGASAIDTPYKAQNARVRYVPSDSPLRQGSYRALASTANNFARECFTDELAEAAGMDPLAFRLANLDDPRIVVVLKAAAAKFGWEQRSKQKHSNRAVGLACGTEKNSVVAACVEVEVDPSSGAPRLLEICQAYECGAILNPANLKAQIEGSIIMGLGGALREEIQFEKGRVKNARFSGYPVPRFRDTPKMDIVLVDKKDAEPIGAGETPLIVVAPAMSNAIYRITGQRVRSLPFPARLVKA